MILHYLQRSCGKIMFLHVSVILFTGGGALCPSMHDRLHDQGVSVQRGVSVQEWRSLSRGSLSRGISVQGVSVQRGVSVRETLPDTRVVTSGRYASYWNALLFLNILTICGVCKLFFDYPCIVQIHLGLSMYNKDSLFTNL